ncbi:MAG: hypothetical protein ACOH2M_17130 [Cypionkella sp.]
MTTIPEMTADQIRTRLATIKSEQTAFNARDFDAELAAVMRKSGDVEALEASHLEAERLARRLRVERSALEAELPAALEREGADKIEVLVEQHGALASKAEQVATAVAEGWTSLVSAIQNWDAVQVEGEAITLRAATVSQETHAPMPGGLGIFNSASVIAVAKEWRDRADGLVHTLSTAERSVDTGIGDMSKRFAVTVLPAEANDNRPAAAARG